MQSVTQTSYLKSDVLIAFEGIKAALARFPQIRNPVSRAKIFNRSLSPKLKYKQPSIYSRPGVGESTKDKASRVRKELLEAGATVYGLLKSETKILPKLLHPQEHVEAVIYGQHNSNSAMLVATNERIIYIDKKPTVLLLDEVSYEVVSGIQLEIHILFASVILHTPVKNYHFKLVNLHCAEKFARHIEKHRLEREAKAKEMKEEKTAQPIVNNQTELLNKWRDMAGYSWLPTEEDERQEVEQLIL